MNVSGKSVAWLVHSLGFQGITRREGTVITISAPDHDRLVLVNRDFYPWTRDCLYVAEITYIRTRYRFSYLAILMDAFSRRIVD